VIDGYQNSDSSARVSLYGTQYTPTTYCDGKNPATVGAQSYNTYLGYVNARRAIQSPLEITAVHEIVGGTTINFEADVTNTSASTVSNVSIHFVAYEDLGTSRHHYTMRKYCPYVTISLTAGQSRHVSSSATLPSGVNTNNIYGVVFAQLRSATNREVLQAAATPHEEIPYEPPAGLFNLGWNWFSLPAIPDDMEASAVFGHNMANTIFMWDKANKTILLYPDDFTDLAMGEGYTLYLHSEVYQPSYFGTPTDPMSKILLPLAGWSWIGYAHNGNTQLRMVRVLNKDLMFGRSAETDAASGDPWVNWNWLYYDSQARTVRICTFSGGDDNTLHSWYGYRVWSNVANIELQIPAG
jgi:hypothetical protein